MADEKIVSENNISVAQIKRNKLWRIVVILVAIFLFSVILGYLCAGYADKDNNPSTNQNMSNGDNNQTTEEATAETTEYVDVTKIYISSNLEMANYVSDGILNVPQGKNGIIFKGNFESTFEVDGFTINNLEGTDEFSLIFKDNASVRGNIYIDAPHISLIWEGSGAPDIDYVNQYMNVKSYNGVDTDEFIAGEGTCKITAGKIAGVDIVVDGNYIFVESSYSKPVALDGAKLEFEACSASLLENDGDFYCIVTDKAGKTWGYKVIKKLPEYKLPVVYITTENGKGITSKEDYVNGSFSIFHNGEYEDVSVESMKIRGRGNSTWKLAKKPYKIKFEDKVSLFGLTKAKEWVLLANHIDRTLMRNTLAFEVGKVTDKFLFTPSSYPVDVFVNGVYAGVYTLGEQIEMKDGRIEGEYDENSTEVDVDYLVEWGGEGEDASFGKNTFSTPLAMAIEIKYPKAETLTKEQYDFIVDYIRKTDEAVKNLEGYEEYLDIDSLIDWFLLYEFSYNTDGIFRRSDYFLKKQGDKLYAAAPWDFDYAFGNFTLDSKNYKEWICLGNSKTDAYEGKYIKDNWITFLIKDPNFIKKLKARWDEIGEKMYQTALETIDVYSARIELSAKDNFAVWKKCLGVKLQYEATVTSELKTYEEQVEYLRNFVINRYEWMDKTIRAMGN